MRAKLMYTLPLLLVIAVVVLSMMGTHNPRTMPEHFPVLEPDEIGPAPIISGPDLATFGNGCFWCTEAVFQQMKGVQNVTSGYCGGHITSPSYAQICTGLTGHAEVVQVTFDPTVVSYAELLEVFWRSHDPTTLNRQGNDVGPQYRSVVFYHSERQRTLAERYKAKIDAASVFRSLVVTEIIAFGEFFPAEADHQSFYANNPRQGYCRVVIGPKVEKLRKVFRDRVKDE